jgi:hypothetical protein
MFRRSLYLAIINEDCPLNGHSRITKLGSANALKEAAAGDVDRAGCANICLDLARLGPDNEVPFTSEKINARSSLEQNDAALE